MEKKFWVIKVHTGKNAKVRGGLFSNLHNAVCSKKAIAEHSSMFRSICGPCFVGNIQKES